MIDLELCTLMMYAPPDAQIIFNRGRGISYRVLENDPEYTWRVAREMAALLRNVHNDEEGA